MAATDSVNDVSMCGSSARLFDVEPSYSNEVCLNGAPDGIDGLMTPEGEVMLITVTRSSVAAALAAGLKIFGFPDKSIGTFEWSSSNGESIADARGVCERTGRAWYYIYNCDELLTYGIYHKYHREHYERQHALFRARHKRQRDDD